MNLFYFFVIYPLTQLIEFVFSFCNKIFDNTGISILGVSCAVSLFTLPLYIVAEHWQQVERDKQKAMKAQVSKIKEVFHGNEQYMILSTYYRQQHYHPIMSLRSAFGLLIQIPFFTAAYSCLSQMSALQGQSFGFIRDMGAPDALFSIGSFQVNVLPILMTLINMVSGTIYTRGLSLRDKLQTYGLALVFVIILYDSPAGLVAYWTMNNLFSLVKNVFYKMKHPVKTLY
ncbi:MAG: YidC/Oxa1 family membrane protein insertase, partial [Spirochaetales bacterium]|nr:YidC/Oxa1 family membrane protein insertase [Spirochaetales bacterium]